MKKGQKVMVHCENNSMHLYCKVVKQTESRLQLYVINGEYPLTIEVIKPAPGIENDYNAVINGFKAVK